MGTDPVIEAANVLKDSSAVILDVRAPDAFAADRIDRAVRVPIEAWEAAAKVPATTFANVAHWQSAIGALGLDGNTLAHVYDDGRMTEASRVWFILQHFGVPGRVVNGGWKALAPVVGARAVKGAPSAVHPARFQARPASGTVGLAERTGLKAQLGGNIQVLDTRTAAEFSGADMRKNPRGGHLPGARHLAHAELLDANGSLRPAGELAALFERAGIKRGDPIVTHCEGGGRAALAAVAALRAGYTGVSNYYLSFADWSRDESCPLVR